MCILITSCVVWCTLPVCSHRYRMYYNASIVLDTYLVCLCYQYNYNDAHPLQGDSYDVDMIVRRLEIEGLLTN